MARPNWFFAFPVEGDFVTQLPDPPPGFRRFHPLEVHLTLAFLGHCDEASLTRALAALDRFLAETPQASLEIGLGQVVPMGSSRNYSALSALVERGRAQAAATIVALRDPLSLAAIGRRIQQPPKPHVTLARPRRNATPERREAGLVRASSLDLAGVVSTLDRIALYTWHEQRRERLFRVVAERKLVTR
jgi:2'-5' RNA ligase